jgi:hypothetical protein
MRKPLCPPCVFTLDRLGRQTAIADATGARSFTYNDALQLSSEASSFGTITRQYDALGRPSGYTLVNPVNPVTPVQTVTYGYTPDGRFGSISATTSHLPPTTWNYTYLPGTDLLAGWSNSAGFAALRIFEPHRDLISSVANTFQGQPIGTFTYANDALARRVSRVDQSAISAQSVATNLFAYNARSELSSA